MKNKHMTLTEMIIMVSEILDAWECDESLDFEKFIDNYIDNTWKTGEHTYSSVIKELEETYLKKNSDYGNSFEDALNEFGEVVGLFMLKMKYDRMTSLFKKGTSEVDESIIDSLDDMINYGIMFSAWLKNKEDYYGCN